MICLRSAQRVSELASCSVLHAVTAWRTSADKEHILAIYMSCSSLHSPAGFHTHAALPLLHHTTDVVMLYRAKRQAGLYRSKPASNLCGQPCSAGEAQANRRPGDSLSIVIPVRLEQSAQTCRRAYHSISDHTEKLHVCRKHWTPQMWLGV